MWEEYNPELEIYALDIDENINKWIQQPNPYHIYIGDQTNPFMIDEIAKSGGPFDFIIDDGSHKMWDIKKSFEFLYPKMTNDGLYIVEDLAAAYSEKRGGGLHNPDSFIEISKNFIDELNSDSCKDIKTNTFFHGTRSINFYDVMIAFQKGIKEKKKAMKIGV